MDIGAFRVSIIEYNAIMAGEIKNESERLSPEEEIKMLERKIAEKKQALTERGAEMPQEKEILREVLREHIEDLRPGLEKAGASAAPSTGSHTFSGGLKKQAEDEKKREDEEAQIRALVEIALTKTVREAARAAQKSSSYLLDELHDHLVNDYYDKLVILRKIKRL